jgi:hypothetical protein
MSVPIAAVIQSAPSLFYMYMHIMNRFDSLASNPECTASTIAVRPQTRCQEPCKLSPKNVMSSGDKHTYMFAAERTQLPATLACVLRFP